MPREKTSITIEKIISKETSTGKKYLVLRNNGDGYFLWNIGWLSEKGIKEGDIVEITHTGGDYPKVLDIQKKNSQEPHPTNEPNGASVISTYHKLQAKQAAMHSSVTFFDGDTEPDIVVAFARKIYKWFLEPEFDEEDIE